MTQTCFQLDLNEIDLERWREILPLAAELINSDEIMTQSPSQKVSTVSIYEALAEILSKPTESLNFYNNKSTDRTLFSEAPSTTESTTTTTTTTISNVQTESLKVDNISSITRVYTSDITPVNIQSIYPNDYNKNYSMNLPSSNIRDVSISQDNFTNSMSRKKLEINSYIGTNDTTSINKSLSLNDSKILMTNSSPELHLMTHRIVKNYGNIGPSASSFFPVYNPKINKNLTTFRINAAHNFSTPYLFLSSSQLQNNNIKNGKTILNGTEMKEIRGNLAQNLTVFFSSTLLHYLNF